jgi:hypothetical protein
MNLLERLLLVGARPPSQITVRTRGGRVLHCHETRRFASAPFGPFQVGADGAVALYVTEVRHPDGATTRWDPLDGDPQITLISASEIVEIDVRCWDG